MLPKVGDRVKINPKMVVEFRAKATNYYQYNDWLNLFAVLCDEEFNIIKISPKQDGFRIFIKSLSNSLGVITNSTGKDIHFISYGVEEDFFINIDGVRVNNPNYCSCSAPNVCETGFGTLVLKVCKNCKKEIK